LVVHEGNRPGPARVGIAAWSTALALLTVVVGHRRAHVLRENPAATQPPDLPVLTLAFGVISLGVLDLLAIALT
jgi:hypothetical protein